MTVSNISDFADGLYLITSSNPIILNFVVDSPYLPTLTAEIKYRIFPDTQFHTKTLATIELLNYKQVGTSYYFTADIQNIVNTLFTNIDDSTISVDQWENLEDNIYDIYYDVTASNGIDTPVSDGWSVTVLNACTQYGQNNIISRNRATVAMETTNESVYAGNGNIVYLYMITSNFETPTLYPYDTENILTDSDHTILTDNDNNIMTE